MIGSDGGVQYSHEMAINDFSETTPLTNEDIAEILSSTNSMFMSDNGDLNRNNGLEKRVGKRSRASKHTPTTFLTAKASDFRALVQQLTGCQSANSYKGPINLNFGAPEDDTTDIDKASTISMLEFNFYNKKTRVQNQQERQQQQHHRHQEQQQLQQHDLDQDDQGLCEEQESSSSGGNAFVSAAYTSPGSYSMTMDDLAMENLFMHDSLDYGEYSSNGIVADEAIVDGDYSSDYGLADEVILFCGY